MKTIVLHFDTKSVSNEKTDARDGEEILEKALELQFRWIQLDWAGAAQVTIFVEDDAMFLAMAYAELDEFSRTGHVHHLFLGDGKLEVTAEREGETVTMSVCHTPHLDRRLSECKIIELSLSNYQHAWWNLMKQLLLQIQLAS